VHEIHEKYENLEVCEEPTKQEKSKDNKGCGTLIATLIVLVVAFTAITTILNNVVNQALPSVNVSRFTELTEEQVKRTEEVLAQIYNSDVRWLSSTSEPLLTNPSGQVVRTYHGDISSNTSRLWMSVSVYTQDYHAINRIRSIRLSAQDQSFVNDNNTEAILRHTSIQRTGSYFLPHNRRRIESYIRIENVVIRFMEWRFPLDIGKSYTDEFIALLVEMLQE